MGILDSDAESNNQTRHFGGMEACRRDLKLSCCSYQVFYSRYESLGPEKQRFVCLWQPASLDFVESLKIHHLNFIGVLHLCYVLTLILSYPRLSITALGNLCTVIRCQVSWCLKHLIRVHLLIVSELSRVIAHSHELGSRTKFRIGTRSSGYRCPKKGYRYDALDSARDMVVHYLKLLTRDDTKIYLIGSCKCRR